MRKHKFYCPVSHHIAWYWELEYKDCPLNKDERNMEECRNCHLRGNTEFVKSKREEGRRRDDSERRDRRGKKGKK